MSIWNSYLSGRVCRLVVQVAAVAMVAIGFTGCQRIRVAAHAGALLDQRDYEAAARAILSLDDGDILESDTLMQMLSTAYYGMVLKPVKGVANNCFDMDFTPDGRQVLFTDFQKKSVNIYSFPEMKYQRSIKFPTVAYSVAVSPNGLQIASAMYNNSVLLSDFATGNPIRVLPGHLEEVRAVAYRDDSFLFSAGNDRFLAGWRVDSLERNWMNCLHSKNIKNLYISKDGSRLITASNDGAACIIKVSGDDFGTELNRLIHGDNYVNAAAISGDNRFAVTVSGDGFVKIWDAETGDLHHSVFLGQALASVDISPDNTLLLVGGSGNLYVVDASQGKTIGELRVSNMPIVRVKFLSDREIAFVDNSRFWHTALYSGQSLVDAARKRIE